jgi:DinB superfamily
MSYYGVGGGWRFCCGGFVGHVNLMFINGAALKPVPPVTPVAMGKATRGVELEVRERRRRTPDRDMDEASSGRARRREEEAVGRADGITSLPAAERRVDAKCSRKKTGYLELGFADLLRAFSEERGGLLESLRALDPVGWSRGATFTGTARGRLGAVLSYARRIADHELHHLDQLRRTLGM